MSFIWRFPYNEVVPVVFIGGFPFRTSILTTSRRRSLRRMRIRTRRGVMMRSRWTPAPGQALTGTTAMKRSVRRIEEDVEEGLLGGSARRVEEGLLEGLKRGGETMRDVRCHKGQTGAIELSQGVCHSDETKDYGCEGRYMITRVEVGG